MDKKICSTCPVAGKGCVRALQDEWVLRNDLPCRLLPTTEAAAVELTRRRAEARLATLNDVVFVIFFGGFFGVYIAGLMLVLAMAFGGV